MNEDELIALVRQIEKRLDEWRSGRDDAPTELQLLGALKALSDPA